MGIGKKSIRRTVLIGMMVLGCVLAFFYFRLSDLRPAQVQHPTNEARGRALLQQMAKAHNIGAWDSIAAYTADFDEEFYGSLGQFTDPFADRDSRLKLQYLAGTTTGQLSYTTKAGEAVKWGFAKGKTYRATAQGAFVQEDNAAMHFWIPTYQYFIAFPKKIQEATAVAYAGEAIIAQRPVVGVLASWGSLAPQKNIDQYLIWLDAQTYKIVKIEYTVREMYPFVSGAVYFKGYKDFYGLPLPTQMPVASNLLLDGYLHKMSLHGFKKASTTDFVGLPK